MRRIIAVILSGISRFLVAVNRMKTNEVAARMAKHGHWGATRAAALREKANTASKH